MSMRQQRQQRPPTLLQFGKLMLDTSARTLTADSVEVPLTNIEFRLLLELVKHPGVALSREALTRAAQVGNYRPLDRAVDVQIARLRRKLRQADADAQVDRHCARRRLRVGAAGSSESTERRRVKLLPLPMFGRIFIALLVMTISALILIAATFSDYQERVTAHDARADVGRCDQNRAGAARSRRAAQLDLRMRVDVFSGPPPAQAYSIASDRRTIALTDALAQSGISVIDTKLDDTSELPVTWLQVQPPQGEARWVGLTGGVQPSSFRVRAWGVLGVLILVITVAAWFTSRWVVRPMARLSQQVDAIGRGEVPTEIVRGTREIERLGTGADDDGAAARRVRRAAPRDADGRVARSALAADAHPRRRRPA